MTRPKRERGWLSRHWFKLATSLAIGAGFVWLLHAGALPIIPGRSAFSRMRWWTIPAYVALWSFVHWLRAARWYWLLEPIHRVPLKRVVNVAFIGFLAIVILPFRTGEMVRPILIRQKGQLSGWAATGTIGAERIIDGLVLSLFLFAGLSLSHPLDPLPSRIGNLPVPAAVVPSAAYAALVLFAAAFVAMGVYYWRRDWARRMTHTVVGRFSPRVADWLAERVEKVADGLSFLPKASYSAPFIGATVVYWLTNALGSWLLAWGCGFDQMDYWEACVNMGVLALGILLPNAPGFFGAFQISVYAALAMYFSPEAVVGPGAAFVLILYLAQTGITIAAAAWGFAAEHTSVREALTPETEDLEARA